MARQASLRAHEMPGQQPVGLLARLNAIQIGPGMRSGAPRISRRELSYILGNLATLVGNGVSLPRALDTLAQERALRKHTRMLNTIRRKIETGEAFSTALASYPAIFKELVVNQIKVGERSGTIAETLQRISEQLEKSNELRGKIIKKLSYPLIVSIAGSGVVTFMLVYVVPQFEETYRKAKVPLPYVTQLLIAIGNFMSGYGWMVLLSLMAAIWLIRRGRQNAAFALSMDQALLRIPVLGDWLRDVAVFQFMEVLGIMLQSGFKLVDALRLSHESVGNRAVRGAVGDLQLAVTRGERLSRELAAHDGLFPPIVSQLVIVGEQTGNLAHATDHVRHHLRREVERKAEIMVGLLEPALTIGMAVAIGIILLAIYMPMFGMIDAVEGVSAAK